MQETQRYIWSLVSFHIAIGIPRKQKNTACSKQFLNAIENSRKIQNQFP